MIPHAIDTMNIPIHAAIAKASVSVTNKEINYNYHQIALRNMI